MITTIGISIITIIKNINYSGVPVFNFSYELCILLENASSAYLIETRHIRHNGSSFPSWHT